MIPVTPLRRLLDIILVLTALLCIWLLVLRFAGYGTLHLDKLPPNTTVQINAVTVHKNSLKLRPGLYTISVTSPKYYTSYETVRISLFGTRVYTPKQTVRTTSSIANAALGAVGVVGAPEGVGLQWFDNDTWTVMNIGPGTPSVLAAHYQDGRWTRVYKSHSSDSSTQLPAEVLNAVINLEAQNNAKLQS